MPSKSTSARRKRLPSELPDLLRPHIPQLAEQIIERLQIEVSEFSKPLVGRFGQGLTMGVAEGLEEFLNRLVDPGTNRDPGDLDVFIRLGRGEARAGREVDSLLAAYRVAVQFSWRHFSDIGRQHDMPSETIFTLADSLFAFFDEMTAASIEGYVRERAVQVGIVESDRRKLMLLLTTPPPVDNAAVEQAAAIVKWKLPDTLAIAVAIPESPAGRRTDEDWLRLMPARLPTRSIWARNEQSIWIALPGDDPVTSETIMGPLRRFVESTGGVIVRGPLVDRQNAVLSLDRARKAAELACEEVRTKGRGIAGDWFEWETGLLLRADPALGADLAARRLAPLDALPAHTADRLAATLEAWLEARGSVQVSAQRLQVHGQTVRYRIGKLRELLPGQLDEPEQTFPLLLALKLRRQRTN